MTARNQISFCRSFRPQPPLVALIFLLRSKPLAASYLDSEAPILYHFSTLLHELEIFLPRPMAGAVSASVMGRL
jgi:hypothetical protein